MLSPFLFLSIVPFSYGDSRQHQRPIKSRTNLKSLLTQEISQHIVGSECMKAWLDPTQGNDSCPLCRQTLFNNDPFNFQKYCQEPGELIARGYEGEPDIIENGEMYLEALDIANWQITSMEQYQQRRALIPSLDTPPRTRREEERRLHRRHMERMLFLRAHESMVRERLILIQTPWGEELTSQHSDWLFQAIEAMGGFHHLPGAKNATSKEHRDVQAATQRQIWSLLRDSGFTYRCDLFDEFDEDGWFRCGFGQTADAPR